MVTVELSDVTSPERSRNFHQQNLTSKCLVKIVAFYHIFTIFLPYNLYIYIRYMSNRWLIMICFPSCTDSFILSFNLVFFFFLSLSLSSYIFWQGVQERFQFFPHINVSVHCSLDSGSPSNSTFLNGGSIRWAWSLDFTAGWVACRSCNRRRQS